MNRGRASSAVLGNLLLVVVVIVFAAGLSVLAFDIGESIDSSEPTASVTITTATEPSRSADCHPTMETALLRISHEAGSTIQTDELRLTGATPTGEGLALTDRCTGLGSQLSARESFTVAAMAGDTVSLQWQTAGANATLAEWSG
ncbi:type IV pilin [Haloarcula sp. GH36]|uniref:type IV pilin n=1 Tax=Haloarcula montana TaxID=3111776 RepID=UPI002D76F27D|nr:type IV pilin [Haloarcula sp. GH36]